MIQLFFKSSKISAKDWKNAYQRILKITQSFPLKLERIESYNGYQRELNKIHYDLTVNSGAKDEHISFWGDRMSFSAKFTVRFYKNWSVQQKTGFTDNETDPNKPIVWFPPEVFDFSGYPPDANASVWREGYLNTSATYSYAVLAIGIMLENILPGRVFLVSLEDDIDDILQIQKWLQYVFNESFDTPIYYDKTRLLENLADHYENKMDLVGRMDMLYMKQFKSNMNFALQHIGYEPTLEYYAHVLTHSRFGTFGFSDVFTPWIAATKDLHKCLELISRSKQILMSDTNNQHNIEEAERYDYKSILKELLNQYILWAPEQREFLEKFYTNKQALETGNEDLMGSIMRLSGYRIDICPIYATSEQLFEAFMYHDPQNGIEYKTIIDRWIRKNKNSYTIAIEKFKEIEKKALENSENTEKQEDKDELILMSKIEKYAENYAPPERFLIIEALQRNPAYMDTAEVVENLHNRMLNLCIKQHDDIGYFHKWSKDKKIEKIRGWIKEKEHGVHPNFQEWIDVETDANVLTSLFVLVTLKIYERDDAYARQQVLLNKTFWEVWKSGGKYSVEKLFGES